MGPRWLSLFQAPNTPGRIASRSTNACSNRLASSSSDSRLRSKRRLIANAMGRKQLADRAVQSPSRNLSHCHSALARFSSTPAPLRHPPLHDEARVWYVEHSNVPGLRTEAPSL